jgi:hypothetical protein
MIQAYTATQKSIDALMLSSGHCGSVVAYLCVDGSEGSTKIKGGREGRIYRVVPGC